MSRVIALYIHVPFCHSKCSYCSFVSYANREDDIPAYLDAVKEELIRHSQDASLSSIYLGGGTPSLLSPVQIGEILSVCHSLFSVHDDTEVTIEVNPGTVDGAYLEAIRTLGINRLSVGVQSFNNGELALLGRIHTANEARDMVSIARSAGFTNSNLDLIFGLPNQTLSDWQNTLEEVSAMGLEHISLYSLSLEVGTPMQRAIGDGYLPDIDPDLVADQYELAEEFLAERGYSHYEISNWAKPGFECCHNITYWRNMPYLGVGVAAHSYLDGHRYANTKDIDEYVNTYKKGLHPVYELDEEISPDLQLAETVILGLRLCKGIHLDDMRNHFGPSFPGCYNRQIEEMSGSGLMECIDGYLKLTPKGRLLSNEVFWRLLPALGGSAINEKE